jgi:DNA polymerase-3 subunit epsilon
MKLCFLDIETTGARPVELFAIIQIAGVICGRDEKGALTEIDSFDFTCAPYPKDQVDLEALEVNGRTFEQILAYDAPKSVHAKLTAVLGKHVDKFDPKDKLFLVAYNASFDTDHLRAWFTKARDSYFGSWFWTPSIDVMTLSAHHLMRERRRLDNFKLGTVCSYLGIELANAHNALADVRATKAVYEHCVGAK